MNQEQRPPFEPSASAEGSQRSSSYNGQKGSDTRRTMFLPSQRSNPIAIARSTAKDPSYTSDEDEDDDDIGIPNEPTRAAQSLPSRLLRAPHLGSLPSNHDGYRMRALDHHQTMLPPPMILSEQPPELVNTPHQRQPGIYNADPVSYGSLRESHMRGRFLDGPASYRDKRTGGIKQLQHRVRFQEGMPASLPQGSQLLSIGERMRRAPLTKESSGDSLPIKKQGSLGEVLQSSPMLPQDDEVRRHGHSPPPLDMHSQPFFEETTSDFDSNNMLSTSLTALEVLQAGLLPGEPHRVEAGDEEQVSLPRNALGHNALLSRALSDPMPYRQASHDAEASSSFVLESAGVLARGLDQQQQFEHRFASNASAAQSTYERGFAPYPPPQYLPQMQLGGEFLVPSENQQAQTYHGNSYYPSAGSHSLGQHGASPDVEGAFDMDLEL